MAAGTRKHGRNANFCKRYVVEGHEKKNRARRARRIANSLRKKLGKRDHTIRQDGIHRELQRQQKIAELT